MSSIRLEHVNQAYVAGVDVLKDFSLTVESGTFCTLVGPSGSGKTTILRVVAGLEKATSGRILIGDHPVQDLPPARRGVAMVFQRPAIYPQLTVRENLAFGPHLEESFLQSFLSLWRESARDKVIDRRVHEVAQLMGLSDALERLPASLSGGQQQRLALGRALTRNPGVLLLDEPFSQLDAGLRSELRHELRLLQRKLEATVIYVTHDQEEAMTLADQLAVIDQGTLQQAGSPAEVYARPHNRFVAQFIGAPTMHFVDGHLGSQSGMITWESVLGSLPAPPHWRDLHTGQANLTLGIRPEDVLVEPGNPDASHIMMRVVLVEALGYANLITLERAGWQATARTDSKFNPAPGDMTPVRLRLENAHLFDLAGKTLKFDHSTA